MPWFLTPCLSTDSDAAVSYISRAPKVLQKQGRVANCAIRIHEELMRARTEWSDTHVEISELRALAFWH